MDLLEDDFDEFLYSALCLVRLWIHALRQFTELLMTLALFYMVLSGRRLQDCLRIQRSAWFDSGYMHCVSLRSL